MKRKFKVLESKKSTSGDNYYTKIVRVVETVFGEQIAESYNVKGTVQLTVGEEIEVDFNIFEGREYESTWADKATGQMITRKVKWLHLKAA
jgi:hypothetical protein